jgi:hypothetical protein
MVKFDRRLLALSDCPVIFHSVEKDPEALGGIIFNPKPVITALDDTILAHEICHRYAGKNAYDVFLTAVIAREGDILFKCILNLLYDCYDERTHEDMSGFMRGQIEKLHAVHILEKPKKAATLAKVIEFYNNQSPISDISGHFGIKIRDHIDLVVIADKVHDSTVKEVGLGKRRIKAKGLIDDLMDDLHKRYGGASGMDIGYTPKMSDYYVKAVGRYYDIIKQLSGMWKRNKYDWINNYYGEINWKDLPGMVLGQKMSLPVFRILAKIVLSRQIYLVIDRSGSTHNHRIFTQAKYSYLYPGCRGH